MPLFFFCDMLGGLMPILSFVQLFHKFSTCSGIHICFLGTAVQIDRKLGFSATHQIVWAEPHSCTSSAVVCMP